jgi:hypothetical protein
MHKRAAMCNRAKIARRNIFVRILFVILISTSRSILFIGIQKANEPFHISGFNIQR